MKIFDNIIFILYYAYVKTAASKCVWFSRQTLNYLPCETACTYCILYVET